MDLQRKEPIFAVRPASRQTVDSANGGDATGISNLPTNSAPDPPTPDRPLALPTILRSVVVRRR